jgi:hypothetical protein
MLFDVINRRRGRISSRIVLKTEPDRTDNTKGGYGTEKEPNVDVVRNYKRCPLEINYE